MSLIDSLEKNAKSFGIAVIEGDNFLDFIRDDCAVRINKKHNFYGYDIINSFDYYYSAVAPIRSGGINIVDYSLPKYHQVYGYERSEILFPSFAEPLITGSQYLDFAKLKKNDIVIDLGAYSGLTSIIFKDIVGELGKVIAVEADLTNMVALKSNIENYKNSTGNSIEILEAAVWNYDGHLSFSTEGNMGSSVSSVVGYGRGATNKVKCYRLSGIVNIFELTQVDFIKCDVEGAERFIFEDADFFAKFKPKIIVEPHLVEGKLTTKEFQAALVKYGYTFREIEQTGVSLPLILCSPP